MPLTKEKQSELEEAFIMHQGADRRLPVSLLGVVVRSIGLSPRESDLQKIENNLSAQGQSSIDCQKVEQIISGNNWVPESLETLKEAFSTFDHEGNGFVPAQEIRYVLTHLGEKLTDEQVDEMIRECDLTGNGEINTDLLAKALLSHI